jgi:hypothetical protein
LTWINIDRARHVAVNASTFDGGCHMIDRIYLRLSLIWLAILVIGLTYMLVTL